MISDDIMRYFDLRTQLHGLRVNTRRAVHPKDQKIEYLRRRTVRVLIEECGLTPCEAGKEYARRTRDYNIAADYTFPDETWDDARRRIVKEYEG